MGRPPKTVNGQPMARTRPTKEEASFFTLVATGVAGWGLVIETLIALERRKILSDKQCRRIIAGAADALQALDDAASDPIIRVAAALLDGQLAGWDRATHGR